jgi:EAL domain-containing protein (putative c-di-GMP-specific phosphodiesterase class I)
MTEAINRVAHVMTIQTIAESAESDSVVAILRELGVDHAQGYALAKPRPIEDLAEESGAAGRPVSSSPRAG